MRRRSGINNRANPIRAKTRAPRGPVIYDRSLQQPFAAHLLDEIRTFTEVNHLIGDASAIQRLARETTRRAVRRRVDREHRGIRGGVHDSSFAPPRSRVNARAPFRVATPMWHTEGEPNSVTCPTPRVSGLVSAPDEGTEQECNRPDQLRQCRYHCYSDLGFLLPIQTRPPHSRRPMAFRHHPVTSSRRCQLPGRNTAGPGSTPRRPHNSLTHTHQRH